MAKILIVEPDKVLARVYVQAFKSAGHRVVLAAGAQTAIGSADRQTPDLVVLELQLAGHNGLEFLYEFRSYPDWQNIPVLINSLILPQEFSESQILWQQLNIGEYFYKPSTTLWQLLHVAEAHLQLTTS